MGGARTLLATEIRPMLRVSISRRCLRSLLPPCSRLLTCAQMNRRCLAYNADIAQTSISGISSGAFMAVQFGVAWSSVIVGVGAIAGGPFDCSEGSGCDGAQHLHGRRSRHPTSLTLIRRTDAWRRSGAHRRYRQHRRADESTCSAATTTRSSARGVSNSATMHSMLTTCRPIGAATCSIRPPSAPGTRR